LAVAEEDEEDDESAEGALALCLPCFALYSEITSERMVWGLVSLLLLEDRIEEEVALAAARGAALTVVAESLI